MVREINKDIEALKIKAMPAVREDVTGVAQDLLDTLSAHYTTCIGMAANMIGVAKSIIAVNILPEQVKDLPFGARPQGLEIMLNPVLKKHSAKSYKTEEGCLSLEGVRPVTRYEWIEISYRDMNWQKQQQRFTGLVAEIIQHEMDHLSGKIV